MKVKRWVAALIMAAPLIGPARAQDQQPGYIQIAELTVDPAQLQNYKAAAREQIDAAIRVEPGVLTLYHGGRPGQAEPHPRVRHVQRHRCLQGPSRIRAFQKVQDNDTADGDIAQSGADDNDRSRIETQISPRESRQGARHEQAIDEHSSYSLVVNRT